jgi:catalase
LKPAEQERLVENIGNHLINAQKFLQDRAVKNFGQADPQFGSRLQAYLDSLSSKAKKVNVVLVRIHI